jgi:hypothetical protein
VDRVVNEFPQAHMTRISLYAGWMFSFTAFLPLDHRGTRSLSASFPGSLYFIKSADGICLPTPKGLQLLLVEETAPTR